MAETVLDRRALKNGAKLLFILRAARAIKRHRVKGAPSIYVRESLMACDDANVRQKGGLVNAAKGLVMTKAKGCTKG